MAVDQNKKPNGKQQASAPPAGTKRAAVNGHNGQGNAPKRQKVENGTSWKETSNGKKGSKHQEPFRRVREEEVQFVDERLKDNRFEAKGGAERAYGLKAHQDLIVTRGDKFRAEKNKKKRGAYRGGQIDQTSYSYKVS
ncbi:SRP40, C-terminal domain-containing protein [Zopfochytrium polystomum]|nr:SRP40, C-terminal domain-containing protein [Zopfochytrium polystomum]